jgi:hypothetical protein
MCLIDHQKLCQPKVRNSSIVGAIKKYVLWLYVAVDDLGAAFFMQVQEAFPSPQGDLSPLVPAGFQVSKE